jgi:hypothetical protein
MLKCDICGFLVVLPNWLRFSFQRFDIHLLTIIYFHFFTKKDCRRVFRQQSANKKA